MSPPADDGALIVTFPRAWAATQRLAFMADVTRALPRERGAHVEELRCTDSIDATAADCQAGLRAVDGDAPARWTSMLCPSSYGWDEFHAAVLTSDEESSGLAQPPSPMRAHPRPMSVTE